MPQALAEAAVRRWEAAGVAPRPGLSDPHLDAFERRCGVRLPAAARALYRRADGMRPGAWDEALVAFWPLAEVGAVPALLAGCRGIPDYGGIETALPDAGAYYLFADHSIWLTVYAVRLTSDAAGPAPVVGIRGGADWGEVAPSFGEFLRRYAEGPWSVV
jgi:hypothetical protein